MLLQVESIDDNEELEYTEDAFNVLGFSDQVCWPISGAICQASTPGEAAKPLSIIA